MPNPKIYLANPYGFSELDRAHVLPLVVAELEALGAEVWEPFARNNQVDLADPNWAYEVGQADRRDVRDCDAVLAVVNGTPPDDGVAIEVGMAIAWGKPVFLLRDDFRRCADSGADGYPINLMWFIGHGPESWPDYFYESVTDLRTEWKALSQWLREWRATHR